MKNIESAKTLTASLPHEAQTLYAWIAEPENLSRWHSSFCRSLRREKGSWIVESPRGAIPVRFIRDDHALVLDILAEVSEGLELAHAIRVLRNGEGAELVWTLVKPDEVSDSIFHEQVRWAGNALHSLRKESLLAGPGTSTPAESTPPIIVVENPASAPVESVEPLQAPSQAEVASMPLSGKKLFIGNLSYAWTDVELRAHFAEQGTVTTAEVARFRGRNGRSRGFGFIEMGSESEAQGAIEKLHGSMGGGRQIIVRLAKSQENRSAAPASPTAEGVPPSIDSAPESAPVRRPPPARHRTDRSAHRGGQRRGPARSSQTGGPSTGENRVYHEMDITNKSGYEIFPRRAPGAPAIDRSQEEAPSRSRNALEASPYMDDTGDIENHGRRPPARRRKR